MPLSPVYEHDGPSEGILVVDLSFEEEDAFPDTSWDEELARKLFSDHNCGLLGSFDDDNIIVLSDFDEEEEVHEEDVVDAEVAQPSVVNSSVPTVSAADADDTPDEVQDNSSDGGDETGSP
jgi:hypothetical protein